MQKVMKMNNRLLKQVMEMDVTIKNMIEDLKRQNAAIKTLKTEKKTLVSLIAGMKVTISDLNREDKKILMNTMRMHFEKNAHSIKRIDELRKVLETHDLGVSILGTSTSEDVSLIRGFLQVIDDVKKDLNNEELNKNIERAFDANMSKFRQQLGWDEDLSVEEWTQIEMKQLEDNMNDEDLVDVDKYTNATEIVKMVDDISDIFNDDDGFMNYDLNENDEVDEILNQITDYQNRLLPEKGAEINRMPIAESLKDDRREQFLKMDPNNEINEWNIDSGMQKIGVGLVIGFFLCTILLINAIKKRQAEKEAKRNNRFVDGETRNLTSL